MGKLASKQQLTFSCSLDGILKSDQSYSVASRTEKRLIRQECIRQLKSPKEKKPLVKKIIFVPPVTHFIPRSVVLRYKNVLPDHLYTPVAPKLIYSTKERDEAAILSSQTRKGKARLNKNRRRVLRTRKEIALRASRWGDGPDSDVNIPTTQMTRRVNILSIASIVNVVNGILLTTRDIIETLKSLIAWGYYAWTSDDFATLTRLSTYFDKLRPGDSDLIKRLFTNLAENKFFLFMTYIYVLCMGKPRLCGPNQTAGINLVEAFLRSEEVPDSFIAIGGPTFREFYLDGTDRLIDHIMVLEGDHFEQLLYKVVNKELTYLRGVRLFKNVKSTLLSIPIFRLAAGISEVPSSVMTLGETLWSLNMSNESTIRNRLQPDDDSYIRFLTEVSSNLSLPGALHQAELSLYRRGLRNTEPVRPPTPPIVELDDDGDEIGEGSGTNNP